MLNIQLKNLGKYASKPTKLHRLKPNFHFGPGFFLQSGFDGLDWASMFLLLNNL